jgi:hypothetical protein
MGVLQRSAAVLNMLLVVFCANRDLPPSFSSSAAVINPL